MSGKGNETLFTSIGTVVGNGSSYICILSMDHDVFSVRFVKAYPVRIYVFDDIVGIGHTLEIDLRL